MVDTFKEELTANNASYICSKWLFERTPFIFNGDRLEYIKFMESLALKLKVDSKSMILTGSSCCGFSLNPNKNFKLFDDNSDIDIAITSQFYFDIAWKTFRDLGTKRYSLNAKQKSSLDDHVNRLIYWGTIATDKLLVILPFGKEWLIHLAELEKSMPINGRTINIRLYKDYDSLRAYHVQNLDKMKIQLYSK